LNWKEYAVLTEGQCVEAVAGIFHSLGSGGVSIAATQTEIGYVVEGKENIHPVSQDYLAHDLVVVKAYFPEDRDIITDLEQSLQLVETNFKVQSRLMLGEVREEDWAAQILSAGAYLFCSGIIESRWPEVQRQLGSYGFVIDQLLKDSEWLGVAARKI
jgi:ribosomal protein L11 methyltransferase